MCVFLCLLKWCRWGNDLLQISQLNGLSLVWVLMWFFKQVLDTNALSQESHWYGFSPVCILLCVLKVLSAENSLLHLSHFYGFSPLWNAGLAKIRVFLKKSPQTTKKSGFDWLNREKKTEFTHSIKALKFTTKKTYL